MQQSKQLRVIILLTVIVVTGLLLFLFFKANGIIRDTQASIELDETKVTIITSDVISDQSWGSLAYKGKLKMTDQFPVSVQLFSEISPSDKDLLQRTIEQEIEAGSKLIIGHGREFSEFFTSIAPKYEHIRFVTLHGSAEHENQTVYSFDQAKIEHFASLAAVLKTKTNIIGIIDVQESNENPEFEQALTYYLPEATLHYAFVKNRDDKDGAVKQLNKLIDSGVDVVYTKGNAFNRDVINVAKKAGIMVIGYIEDQSYMAPDLVLTSVMNDTTEVYVSIMDDYFSEEGIPSGKVMLTDEDGVYMLAPFGPMYTDEEIEYIESEIEKFHRGELLF